MAQRVSSRLAVLALAAALALAGCGRKGPLELPPTATGAPATSTGPTPITVPRSQAQIDDPGLIQPPNKTYQVPAAEQLAREANKPARAINEPLSTHGKPFILDPLL